MKKLIISILLCIILFSSRLLFYSKILATNSDNIKILNYTSAKPAKKSISYNLNSYTNKNSLGWLSNYEVLTVEKKSSLQDSNSTKDILYLSIFNVDTGKSKDFTDVNLGKFISISPDKKYALYEELKEKPGTTNPQLEQDIISGNQYNYNIKLLNLITGEIKSLKTKFKNYIADYQWIDDNKIFIYYPDENETWEIEDLSGNILNSGDFSHIQPNSTFSSNNIKGFSELISVNMYNVKITENKISGSFILYYIFPSEEAHYEILVDDLESNEKKSICSGKSLGSYSFQNNILLIGEYNGTNSKLYYYDEKGKKKGEYSFQGRIDTSSYSISKDGTKAAIPEQIASPKNMPLSHTTNLNILDLKSGKISKVFQTTSIVNPKSMNVNWNNNGTSLIFNIINKVLNLNDTYLIRIQ